MTSFLGITMLVVARNARSCFGFRTLVRELINDNFTQTDLGMIWFIHRKFYMPSGLVSRCFHSLLADFVV